MLEGACGNNFLDGDQEVPAGEGGGQIEVSCGLNLNIAILIGALSVKKHRVERNSVGNADWPSGQWIGMNRPQ